MATDNSLGTQLAAHLDSLMQASTTLSTNAKLARQAGVSINTVRRVRVADETDVSIANLGAIASAFKLTLGDFVSGAEAGVSAPDLSSMDSMVNPTPTEQIIAQISAWPENRILALGAALGMRIGESDARNI